MSQITDPASRMNAVDSVDVLDIPDAARTKRDSDIDLETLRSSLRCIMGKVDKHPKTAAIILAGGSGERFGKEGGKQLVEIAGKPVLT